MLDRNNRFPIVRAMAVFDKDSTSLMRRSASCFVLLFNSASFTQASLGNLKSQI
jgi:hypothetical protein